MSNAEGTHPEDEDFAKKYDRRKVEVADALISLEAPVADDRVAVPPSKRLAATMETSNTSWNAMREIHSSKS